MKDALGHGSNSNGGSMLARGRGIIPARPFREGRTNEGGGQPVSSNAAAGAALIGALRKTQAPVHPAMSSDQIAYNRDLAFRVRNRMVGSGMRAR